MIYFPHQQIKYPSSGFVLDTPEVHLESAHDVAIVGPNGSGKSTWAKAQSGLLDNAASTQEKWFYIPQSMEQIFFAETFQGQLKYLFPDGYNDERVLDNLEKVGLDSSKILEYPIRWLSGGERRRSALALAWYMQPQYLILDEPTIGLSPKEALLVNDYLNILAAELSGFLVITHALDFETENGFGF